MDKKYCLGFAISTSYLPSKFFLQKQCFHMPHLPSLWWFSPAAIHWSSAKVEKPPTEDRLEDINAWISNINRQPITNVRRI